MLLRSTVLAAAALLPAAAALAASPDSVLRLDSPAAAAPAAKKPRAARGPNAAQPETLAGNAAFSAAVISSLTGPTFSEDALFLAGDWDGREDHTADRQRTTLSLGTIAAPPPASATITRTAISEHTLGNGHNRNIFYFGDSLGTLHIAIDNTGDGEADSTLAINLPQLVNVGTSGGFALLNPLGGDLMSGNATINGLAVNPVSDLGDFGASLCGVIGETIYVSVRENGAGAADPGSGQTLRTRIFAMGIYESAGSIFGTGLFQILRHRYASLGGVAIDDDGSLYFHLIDEAGMTGGAIFKAAERSRAIANCGVVGVNRAVVAIPSGLANPATFDLALAAPLDASGYRLTNFSGGATTFGNIAALACGPGGALFAAVARSRDAADPPNVQATEGAFANPPLLGATPSMIISFADVAGALDACSAPFPGFSGAVPIGDGIADSAESISAVVPGVNNFRAFALGAGPDRRGLPAFPSPVFGSTATTLQLDFQIDYSIYGGLAIDEEGKAYVISGGTPSGVAPDPSPDRGEILLFADSSPADRRADYLDFRGDAPPVPPASGGNFGDGDSDRFDHIFLQAPIDQATQNPAGLAGLARGFLLYLNRSRDNALVANLPSGATQSDDGVNGPLLFDQFDPSHQVAGGSDAAAPFTGDDAGGGGQPPDATPGAGGFEFLMGASGGQTCAATAWNAFFLNANGSVSFGFGDSNPFPSPTAFRAGPARLAPLWSDLNVDARAGTPAAFPVQALGFAGVNSFKIRYINVPEAQFEICANDPAPAGNSFSVLISDDGTGRDENAIGEAAEGPTDQRYEPEPATGLLIGQTPRLEGSGPFVFEYGRVTALGTSARQIIAGYSVGGLSPTNPPGLCETDLSEGARFADTIGFGLFDEQTGASERGRIGDGLEPTIFEIFRDGAEAFVDGDGFVFPAEPDFDLRAEGNDPIPPTPAGQPDLNRGSLSFHGTGCPAPLSLLAAIPAPTFNVAPDQPFNFVNAVGDLDLSLLGHNFRAQAITVICRGVVPGSFAPELDAPVPVERFGKTVSTAALLAIDTNGDLADDLFIGASSVFPTSPHYLEATFPPQAGLPGTPFPISYRGGPATLWVSTTVSAGDNNIVGPFSFTAAIPVDLGLRAPTVTGISIAGGDCEAGVSAFRINGVGFRLAGPPAADNVTEVFARELGNAANVVEADSFAVLNDGEIDAVFAFGAANGGKSFLIYASGPNGTSRNLESIPPTAPAGTPLGNELGAQVIYACAALNQALPGWESYD